MTKELLPGPGSGALREALEQIASITCGCHDSADANWHGKRCPKGIALAALSLSSPIEPAPLNQRAWDLIRHQRMELHTAGLITDEEYAALARDHDAVYRLENYDKVMAQASSEIRERVRQERVLVLEDVITRLQERMGNEEYSHAKAAVALDIEAVEEMKAEAERSLAGDWTQHHLHVQPSSDCHLCRALVIDVNDAKVSRERK